MFMLTKVTRSISCSNTEGLFRFKSKMPARLRPRSTATLVTNEQRGSLNDDIVPIAKKSKISSAQTTNAGTKSPVASPPSGISLHYEKARWSKGFKAVAGVDEAGRGPLAGPVVAAAVIVSPEIDDAQLINGINDSKQLTAEERESLYELIIKNPTITWAVTEVSVETIDTINILQATMKAMEESVAGLSVPADFILVDGNRLPKAFDPETSNAITKGDTKVYSIACASIIAKVYRDRIMRKLHQEFPQYSFDDHMGYGTAKHVDRIKQHGPCVHHRRSFNPVKSLFFPDFEYPSVVLPTTPEKVAPGKKGK